MRLLFGSDDVLHVHWPDYALKQSSAGRAMLKVLAMFALMDLARLRGKKIIWTVHNLGSHEGFHPRLERWFWKNFVTRLDGYISLSESGKSAFLERFPAMRNVPGFVIPHGHYRGSYPCEMTREKVRSDFGIAQDAPVLVFLGNIRAYKNVAHLIRTFRQIQNTSARLLVAGNGEREVVEEIKRLAKEDSRVHLFLGYVPDERVQLFMRAADLVVLPFREILNSGSALLALSFDRPVLVPKRGAMGDLQALVREDWVRTYGGELTSEELSGAIEWALSTKRSEMAPLEALGWEAIASSTLEAYRKVCHVPAHVVA